MSAGTRRFALRYLEMLAAMVAGMVVLGFPAGAILRAAGLDPSGDTGVMLVEMGATMTLGMVAWMRVRGHAWQPCLEMTAAMIVPTAGSLGLLGLGIATGSGTLMIVEHAVMLPSMLAAMLVRRSEYAGHHLGHTGAYA